MRRISLRVTAVALALVGASLLSFPVFPTAADPSAAVDRSLKGNRLPLVAPRATSEIGARSAPLYSSRKIPLGCDAAFSAISAPQLANVFRRCAV